MKNFKKLLIINLLIGFSFVTIEKSIDANSYSIEEEKNYPLHKIIIDFNEQALATNENYLGSKAWMVFLGSVLKDINNKAIIFTDPEKLETTFEVIYFEKDKKYNRTPLELAKHFQKEYRENIWKKLGYMQRVKYAGGLLSYNDEVTNAWDRIIKHLESLQKGVELQRKKA